MAKITNYTRRKIAKCTGEWLKDCVDWLVKEQCGCCHIKFGTDAENDYCICVGWHDCGEEGEKGPDDDGYRVAWKIGRQAVGPKRDAVRPRRRLRDAVRSGDR